MKKLAIHIVSWNGEKYISRLFESLQKQTFTDFSVYIWDNASEDDTVAAIQRHTDQLDLEIIEHETNINFAAGHNRLFAKTQSDYILVLNQDTYLEADCIQKLVSYMDANSSVAAAAPRLLGFDETIIDSLGLQVLKNRRVVEGSQGKQWSNVKMTLPDAHREVFGVSAALAIYRRGALDEVAFAPDEIFDRLYTFYKEDIDLAYRLQSAGWDATVLLEAVAYHDRTISGDKKMGDVAASKGKKHQSDAARYHSYKNHLMTLLKNMYWQNYVLDGIWIEWYEFKKLGWLILFDRKTVGAVLEILKERKEIKRKRLFIISKRKRTWKEMHTSILLIE